MAEYDLSDYDYEKRRLENELKELTNLFAMAVASCGGKILVPDKFLIRRDYNAILRREYDAANNVTVFSIKGYDYK